MTVAYMGEKVFMDEVRAANQLWVARGTYNNIYAVELDEKSISLPVWSGSERVTEFLRHALLVGTRYEPHPVALEVFTKAWLSDRTKAIAELQLNPDGRSSRVLVCTPEEFLAAQTA